MPDLKTLPQKDVSFIVSPGPLLPSAAGFIGLTIAGPRLSAPANSLVSLLPLLSLLGASL